MNVVSRLKIGTRLTVAFAIVVALLLALTLTGVDGIGRVARDAELIVNDGNMKIALAHTIENEVNRVARSVQTALIATEPATVRAELAEAEAATKAIGQAIESLRAVLDTPRGKAALADLERTRAPFRADEQKLLALLRADRVDEARRFLVVDMLPTEAPYLAAIEALASTQAEENRAQALEAAEVAGRTRTTMFTVAGFAMALAVVLGLLLSRSITRPLADAVRVAQTVAAGDLTSVIVCRGRDETTQLLGALSTMQDQLAQVVHGVRSNAQSVAAATSQIAQGNLDLSSRTEEQASALQQTAASMEQLGAAVTLNAESARQADGLSQEARQAARRSSEDFVQLVQTMEGISVSSRRIADILGVIDAMAFQTNILALNAAVEAARAGEQGRGFAVVASEVRGLAVRSAAAAREIKELIAVSLDRVEHGTALVDRTALTMNETVASIGRVAERMGEISAASAEQSAGVAQVGEAVGQMDRTTQQNAALVEESAAAADSLRSQAHLLVQAVSAFTLAPRDGAAPAAGRAASVR